MISKIKKVLRWRELILSLALKDLKIKYHQAAGGFGWLLIFPLSQMLIFSFIFLFIFKIKIENYPLFLLCGLFPWGFLKSSLDQAANSILSNANLIKKTYFPREILSIANIITNLISFLISLIVLTIFSVFYHKPLFAVLYWLPLIIFVQIILITGISLLFAGLNTLYRETQFIMEILLLIWFYGTPIVYPIEMAKNALPHGLFELYSYNPMLGIIYGYQQIFVSGLNPSLELLAKSSAISFIIFLFGWNIFSRCEDKFMDMV